METRYVLNKKVLEPDCCIRKELVSAIIELQLNFPSEMMITGTVQSGKQYT